MSEPLFDWEELALKLSDKYDRAMTLLKRMDGHICHHEDCVHWTDCNYCDCALPDLLEDMEKKHE